MRELGKDIDPEEVLDQPVRLKSTTKWPTENVSTAEIIVDIIHVCLNEDKIRNPWKIEEAYFETLSPHQALIETAAMISWLNKVMLILPSKYSKNIYISIQIII